MPNNVNFVGLIEYDGSIDPAIIVGDTAHAVLRQALATIQHKDKETDEIGLCLSDSDEFLTEYPFPSMEDPDAIADWFKEMNADDYVGEFMTFTLYGGPAPEGFEPTMQAVTAPNVALWIEAPSITASEGN